MTAQQLKNSILQMAVQGKLVPQDPSDEPASVLLERIRKEKEKLIKEGKIKREKNPSVIFRGVDNTPYEKVGNNEPVSIADEVPFEIPESWTWCRLGMVSTYAQTKKIINAKDADPKTWGLDLEDIEKGGRLLVKHMVGERKAVGDKTLFEKGDILYSKLRPYLLKILVADEDGICTPEIVPFKVYGNIDAEYIVAYLQSPYVDSSINAATYGVKMPRAGTETMTALLVPIPPLAEQRRIAAKIKQLMPYIELYNAKEQTLGFLNEAFPDQLKKSILQMAVQGKLVPQDPSDEPASVILKRIRAEKERLIREGKIKRDKNESVIFRRDNSHYEKRDGKEVCIDDSIPYEIPDSWEWVRLGCITFNRGQCTPDKAFCYIDIGSIDNENQRLNTKETVLSPNEAPSRARKIVGLGDILYSTVRPYLHNMCVIDRQFSHIPIASTGFAVMTCHSGIYNQYLFYYLMSPTFDAYANDTENSKGVAYPAINDARLYQALVPIPPMAEQERIVDMINRALYTIQTM